MGSVCGGRWGGVVCGRLKLWNDTGRDGVRGRRRVRKQIRWTDEEKGVAHGEQGESSGGVGRWKVWDASPFQPLLERKL